MPSNTSTYNQSQLAHYAFLESMDSKIDYLRNQAIEKKRAASLEMFLAEDAICLLKTKKHPTLPNDIIGPLYIENEEEPLNLWRCFGRCPQPGMKKNLKRTASKDEAPVTKKSSKFNITAPVFVSKSSSGSSSSSGYNASAPEFVPKSSSGSSTPAEFNVSAPVFVPNSSAKKSSEFNADAPEFVPKSASGSSTPTGFNVAAQEFIPKSRGSSQKALYL